MFSRIRVNTFLHVWLAGLTLTVYEYSPAKAIAGEERDVSTQLPLPPVSQVVDRALDYLPRSLASYERWKNKMQWAAAVPELQLQYLTDENLSRYQGDPGRHWEDGFRVTLSWNMSKFVFNPEQLEAVKVQQRLKDQEINLIKFIIDQYYNVRSALLAIDQNPDQNKRSAHEDKALRSASQIDSLTNDTFAITRRIEEYIQVTKSVSRPPGSREKTS